MFTNIFNRTPKYEFNGKYTALDVARYLIRKCTLDDKPVSNLQVQKILYYIQLSFIQEENYALFSDEIEAWQFGPVVRSVYRKYCGYGAAEIYETDSPVESFSKHEEDKLDKIIEEKRMIEPWYLVSATHEEGKPWDLVYRNGIGDKKIIPKGVIADYG